MNGRPKRRGAIALQTAILMVPLLGSVALAIDLGILVMSHAELHAAADSAAIAGATLLKSDRGADEQDTSRQAAQHYAAANRAFGTSVSLDPDTDIEFGFWDVIERKFLPPRSAAETIRINAIRVILRRDATNAAGPITHFFAPFLGIDSSDTHAESIAYSSSLGPGAAGYGTRFLIDEDMFDTDIPAIEDLADQLNLDADKELLWHRIKKGKNTGMTGGSNDPDDWDWSYWFLQIPPGTILELPTGQVGDEALLDLSSNIGDPDLPQYPFAEQAAHELFLRYDEGPKDGKVTEYQYNLLDDSDLDPVHGIGRFNQPGNYPALVNPDFVHVSPVWKGDVSAGNGIKNSDKRNGPDIDGDGRPDGYTTNSKNTKGVNAKSQRRGLVAFRIIGINIDEPYPYLPNLIIEIVDPATIDLGNINPVDSEFNPIIPNFSPGGAQNIRLVQ